MNCINCGHEMSHHYYSYYNHDASQCDIEIVECANCQIAEPAQLAALREAGEKMAKQLRILSKSSYFTREDAAAIDAWESANK